MTGLVEPMCLTLRYRINFSTLANYDLADEMGNKQKDSAFHLIVLCMIEHVLGREYLPSVETMDLF